MALCYSLSLGTTNYHMMSYAVCVWERDLCSVVWCYCYILYWYQTVESGEATTCLRSWCARESETLPRSPSVTAHSILKNIFLDCYTCHTSLESYDSRACIAVRHFKIKSQQQVWSTSFTHRSLKEMWFEYLRLEIVKMAPTLCPFELHLVWPNRSCQALVTAL